MKNGNQEMTFAKNNFGKNDNQIFRTTGYKMF